MADDDSEIDWLAAADRVRRHRLNQIREKYAGVAETLALRRLYYLVANEANQDVFNTFLSLPEAIREAR